MLRGEENSIKKNGGKGRGGERWSGERQPYGDLSYLKGTYKKSGDKFAISYIN